MVILALDLGGKRIGIAKSDALGMMAHPIGTVERKTDDSAIGGICALAAQHRAVKIVIGLPKNMDGSSGRSAMDALSFGESLKKRLPDMDLVYWDERLSTCAVQRTMSEAGVSARKQKGKVDTLAAQWILEGYLSSLKR